ncbi:MAG: hypothetical protein UY48_C0003G0028 [Candidatus Gottesmanbacteria bacterium GW2011_GWB1_49_7]|uniref:Uncharacterized protein n=1 Tax=Candidatus Gottesmanbacteria bacterium GW2011_GWB1_49_7 TaxID=1618448 RepID=A0A0G1W379_9BACT|nr:MAG: hypothetical protein UY48_C0003G0028 [Candidatus Gottesmanbacteria bacterium GW2011_GWB1_49_7]
MKPKLKPKSKPNSTSSAYIVAALVKVGVTISSVSIDGNYARGVMICRTVKGFNYRKASCRYPWSTIKWFASDSGGGDGEGNGQYSFHIDLGKLPKTVRKKILSAWAAINTAEYTTEYAKATRTRFAHEAMTKAQDEQSKEWGLKEMQENLSAANKKFWNFFADGCGS